MRFQSASKILFIKPFLSHFHVNEPLIKGCPSFKTTFTYFWRMVLEKFYSLVHAQFKSNIVIAYKNSSTSPVRLVEKTRHTGHITAGGQASPEAPACCHGRMVQSHQTVNE